MVFGHFGDKKEQKRGFIFGRSSHSSGISHSSIHDSKHNKNFHSSIHDQKKIHEAMHLGKDNIISPFNHKVKYKKLFRLKKELKTSFFFLEIIV